jgi:hypothetical protein
VRVQGSGFRRSGDQQALSKATVNQRGLRQQPNKPNSGQEDWGDRKMKDSNIPVPHIPVRQIQTPKMRAEKQEIEN